MRQRKDIRYLLMIYNDKFTQEEKNIIENLKETKKLECKCQDLTPDEFELYVRRVTKQMEKVFKLLSFVVFAVLFLFIIAYINDKDELEFMYPWLFILCIALGIYLYLFGHWWNHKHDKKVYEFKSAVLKFDISIYKGVAKNVYSIAEVLPDGSIRYFGIVGESQERDKIYEKKLLMANMIREKGQTKVMFDIDRKSMHIIGDK